MCEVHHDFIKVFVRRVSRDYKLCQKVEKHRDLQTQAIDEWFKATSSRMQNAGRYISFRHLPDGVRYLIVNRSQETKGYIFFTVKTVYIGGMYVTSKSEWPAI